MSGPRILSTPESPVQGPSAPTGIVRAGSAWLAVQRGAVVATHAGTGSKLRAIQAAGTNRVIV